MAVSHLRADDDDESPVFQKLRKRAVPRVRGPVMQPSDADNPADGSTTRVASGASPTPPTGVRLDSNGEVVPRFRDGSLQELHERGILDDIVARLKSGKEATVYVGVGPDGPCAVKVYRSLGIRSFRNDKIYREGRFIGDTRIKRAIEHATRQGRAAHEWLWIEEEYRQLVALHEAGVCVPKPLGHAGRAVAMEFIGVGHDPAPRLSDLRLPAPVAAAAFDQAVENLRLIVESGRVHGDYSAFNLLWHDDHVVVIDFPQVVYMHESASAAQLLQRDIASLCHSFRRHGIEADPDDVLHRVIDAEQLRRLTEVWREE